MQRFAYADSFKTLQVQFSSGEIITVSNYTVKFVQIFSSSRGAPIFFSVFPTLGSYVHNNIDQKPVGLDWCFALQLSNQILIKKNILQLEFVSLWAISYKNRIVGPGNLVPMQKWSAFKCEEIIGPRPYFGTFLTPIWPKLCRTIMEQI